MKIFIHLNSRLDAILGAVLSKIFGYNSISHKDNPTRIIHVMNAIPIFLSSYMFDLISTECGAAERNTRPGYYQASAIDASNVFDLASQHPHTSEACLFGLLIFSSPQ